MSSPTPGHAAILAREALQAFHDLNGPQPGYRPAHAKGILLAGTFTAAPEAALLTIAPHVQRKSTPVAVRFSDFAGVPAVPDNDPNASPRGIAVRFYLAEHVHTDIIGHSVDGFPARTAEEFTAFLRAIYASGAGAPHPTPIEQFLAARPAAREFVAAPKPFPVSFAAESYYSVSAHRFVDAHGQARYGRYRIRPEGAGQYLDEAAAAGQAPNFLFDEIRQRLARGAVTMRIAVQIAAEGDVVDDSTAHWPAGRPEVPFGVLDIRSVIPDNDAEQRHIIFDPIPRVAGIESSADPLLEVRATAYLMSGRQRRAEGGR